MVSELSDCSHNAITTTAKFPDSFDWHQPDIRDRQSNEIANPLLPNIHHRHPSDNVDLQLLKCQVSWYILSATSSMVSQGSQHYNVEQNPVSPDRQLSDTQASDHECEVTLDRHLSDISDRQLPDNVSPR
jgi:hypothetical protein